MSNKQPVQEHQVTKLNVAELVFDTSNPNVMSNEQMTALRKSMQKFGYLTPVIIDQHNNIADGEHRALVYKEMGITEIPVIRLKLETDSDRKQLRQVMNKLHGEHDRAKDADELVELFKNNKLDELTELLAQPKDDMLQLMLRYHPDLDWVNQETEDQVDQIIDEEMKRLAPDTKLGDIWQLGRHKIACGDCTDRRLVDELLDGRTIDQLNCDPPFGVMYGDKNKDLNTRLGGHRIEDPFANDEIEFDYYSLFTNLVGVIPFSDYNTIYIWTGDRHLRHIHSALDDSDVYIHQYLVWAKNNHSITRTDYQMKHEFCLYGWKGKHKFHGGFRTSVLEYNKPMKNDLHPTMKPIELIRQTVTDGTKEGDTILDTFAGSGTSLIACEQTNRIWRGIEIDPRYVDVIIKRWESYTGEKAEKII